jgi:branched-chain amino acid transport system substrate-binding protein
MAKRSDDPNVNAALGYESYMILIDAIERAGSADPEAIHRKPLLQPGILRALQVSTTINESHDARNRSV